ncbi:hypothetical protein FACS1894190_08540 [Spirochaetia bacterium]|nr:hypothetical protein FACS1894190_08540 [Spirochaetia bacterium]
MAAKKILFVLLMLLLVYNPFAEEPDYEQYQRDTINYGTDNEIAELIRKLKTDNITYLDNDLIALSKTSKNINILNNLFLFFSDREQGGLEDAAMDILQQREEKEPQIVNAAITYLGQVKYVKAQNILQDIIKSNEDRYRNISIKALGKTANGTAGADAISGMLMEFYNNNSPSSETQREIVAALGSAASNNSLNFLLDIIKNNDEGAPLRMAALDAAAKIKNNAALDVIIEAAGAQDVNVRASAISALGSFSGERVEQAIIDGFRDTFFRTRLAAVKAAGDLKLAKAAPFLRYRAERDEVASVKEEAVRALGAIDRSDTNDMLKKLFEDQKNSDKLRILCAEMLLKNNAEQYADQVITKLDDVKSKKQTAFYNGLLKALSNAKTDKVKPLAARLFSSKDIIEKSFALEITAANKFTNFKEEVEKISEDKKNSLSRKAADVLSKL